MSMSIPAAIDAMYSMKEPWLTRFLELMAVLANDGKPNGHRPTRREVEDWLTANPALCREVCQLLYAWRVPER